MPGPIPLLVALLSTAAGAEPVRVPRAQAHCVAANVEFPWICLANLADDPEPDGDDPTVQIRWLIGFHEKRPWFLLGGNGTREHPYFVRIPIPPMFSLSVYVDIIGPGDPSEPGKPPAPNRTGAPAGHRSAPGSRLD